MRVTNYNATLHKLIRCFGLLVGLVFSMLTAFSTSAEPLPQNLSAAITHKVVQHESFLSQHSTLVIWAFGNKGLQESLQAAFSTTSTDFTTSSEVILNPSLEGVAPSVIVIDADYSKVAAITEYAKKHKILTIANGMRHQNSGAAVILADDEGVPSIFLNLSACKSQGLRWQAEFLDWVIAL